MTAATACRTCGTERRVPFADVVHSMDVAAAVGPQRLREIMADLGDRCAAVFGAPIALEDHAFRACRLAGSLPRDGEIAWLRRAYRVGRGDAMTAVACPEGDS